MQLPKGKKYTYADYLTWDDSNRYELIDGVPYMMAPAPSTDHQRAIGGLFNQLYNYLKGKACEVFVAPFDVQLAEDTVVQPDISIVCDRSKLGTSGCKGAPDMVIEILSPSSTRLDRITKRHKYLEAGVREYWIVDPDLHSVETLLLRDDVYVSYVYADKDLAPVNIFDDCVISLEDVFPPAKEEPTDETSLHNE